MTWEFKQKWKQDHLKQNKALGAYWLNMLWQADIKANKCHHDKKSLAEILGETIHT